MGGPKEARKKTRRKRVGEEDSAGALMKLKEKEYWVHGHKNPQRLVKYVCGLGMWGGACAWVEK